MIKKITWKELKKNLDWLEFCNGGIEKEIKYYGISNLGLELAEESSPKSIDIAICFGRIQQEYLLKFPKKIIERKISNILSGNPPLIILSRSFDYEIIKKYVLKYNIAVFKTKISSSNINLLYISYLVTQLSPELSIHANLIEVSGVGILLIGESGLGKSEISLELIKKGHQFIADDCVLYKKIFNKIHGRADEKIKGFIEIRGLGIINLEKLFGVRIIKDSCQIDIIVELEMYSLEKTYERLGEINKYQKLFDIDIPYFKIPVSPGKKISEIIEVLAGIQKLKLKGYSSLEDFKKSFESFDNE